MTTVSTASNHGRRKLAISSPRTILVRAREGSRQSEDVKVAVCVLPGTELSFAEEVRCLPTGLIGWRDQVIEHKTAIFRHINKDKVAAHHDALEFPDGRIALVTRLCESQQATVLQLPAEPKTAVEAQSQRRVAYIA